MKRTQFSIL